MNSRIAMYISRLGCGKSRYGRNGGLRRDGEEKNLLIYMDFQRLTTFQA